MPTSGLGFEAHELALDLRTGLQSRPGRLIDRLVENASGVGHATRLEERRPERREQLGPRHVVALQGDSARSSSRAAAGGSPRRRAPSDAEASR